MTLEDEIVVLKADREGLHQRVLELLADNTRLRDRLGPLGLEVVMIGDAGHYVNDAVKAEIGRLRNDLTVEREITQNLTWAIEQLQATSR
jgi:hypothetical protein